MTTLLERSRAILLHIRPWGFSEKPEGGNFTYNQAGEARSPEEDLLIIDTFVSLFYVNDISSQGPGVHLGVPVYTIPLAITLTLAKGRFTPCSSAQTLHQQLISPLQSGNASWHKAASHQGDYVRLGRGTQKDAEG